MMITVNTIIKVRKMICKVFYEKNNLLYKGTGFFVLLNNYFNTL